jgi:16S rRNA (guanine966-N2)-methyltransferase
LKRAGGGELRLTAGIFGGRRIATAPSSRPTQGRVREALLSRWQLDLPGAQVLELFCGSAAVSLEALSRGARLAVAVDHEIDTAMDNARNLGLSLDSGDETGQETGIFLGFEAKLPGGLDAVLSAAGTRRKVAWNDFHRVFADPPYDWQDWPQLFITAAARLSRDRDRQAELVLEHTSRARPLGFREAGLELSDHRSYGESCLSFYRLLE